MGIKEQLRMSDNLSGFMVDKNLEGNSFISNVTYETKEITLPSGINTVPVNRNQVKSYEYNDLPTYGVFTHILAAVCGACAAVFVIAMMAA